MAVKLSVTFSADSVEGLCESMRAWADKHTTSTPRRKWEALVLDTAALCFAERLSVPVAEFITAALKNVAPSASTERDTRMQNIQRALKSLSIRPDSGIVVEHGNVELY